MKYIPGYEGLYSADEEGNIYSHNYNKTGTTQKLKAAPNSRGRLEAVLSKDKTTAKFPVHKLVLLTFVGECPEGMESCHRDGNPLNNSLENLRWDSRTANGYDRLKHKTHNTQKLSEQDVKDIRWMLGLEVTQKELALMFGVKPQSVYNIRVGKTWSHI
jgi:HNH endonuclease